MTHGSLFSGIGGFDLAAQWMGWENKFHCEWNEFGQKVLHHYWPEAELFTDITKSDFTKYHGTIDIISGGFPCQPYSMAGKRLGKEDDRHLFPEMLRVIREVRPRWVVGENVLGLVNWNGGLVFHEVQTDLEAEGYEVQPFVLPAAAVGAPHRRDRVWFVAYANNSRADIEMRSERIRSEKNHGRQEQSFVEHREDSGDGDAADTNLHGRNERDGKHEEQSGKRGVDAQRDIEQSDDNGNAADTDISTARTSGASGGAESNRRADDVQQSERGEQTQQHNRSSSFSRNASDANGGGRRETIRERKGKSNVNDQISEARTWGNFPTKSPICGRNDGLPNQLDGITFSKWRNESIKAYGNAVVPQVVYQIFKAIEQYENMHK